ncbi:hypothetical protein VV01_22025 [Luteipulveratus halotolerans]|uniref:Uncharacterized protein n=1 Tax=Luteipulveratus halotolerans TaxID=1631356 RepID=A0A0L6CDS6_9MICO|nr:hypothetical protein VV01_21350 [Luteipulveratus halotolerans]KNX35934.1 hypothetical protein VV01_22025 [Luteipulveratus halotolerans]
MLGLCGKVLADGLGQRACPIGVHVPGGYERCFDPPLVAPSSDVGLASLTRPSRQSSGRTAQVWFLRDNISMHARKLRS